MEKLLDPLRSAAARILNVRCPHCHNAIELVDHTQVTSLSCPSCGSDFSLVSDGSGGRFPGGMKKIGQFQLIEQVGVGQFGCVWKAAPRHQRRNFVPQWIKSQQHKLEYSIVTKVDAYEALLAPTSPYIRTYSQNRGASVLGTGILQSKRVPRGCKSAKYAVGAAQTETAATELCQFGRAYRIGANRICRMISDSNARSLPLNNQRDGPLCPTT